MLAQHLVTGVAEVQFLAGGAVFLGATDIRWQQDTTIYAVSFATFHFPFFKADRFTRRNLAFASGFVSAVL